MVGMVGLEPTRIAPPEPKSGASTNFATSPFCLFIYIIAQKIVPFHLYAKIFKIFFTI